MQSKDYRIGIGFDAHKFSEDLGRKLWLACLKWDGELGLEGNSDADVITHAIADALLSSAGLPDIGVLLKPESDYKDAHGDRILRVTSDALQSVSARIVNVSAQLIGNRPKFAPRRREAESAVSGALFDNPPVSISATTTDSMGFTGRGEGLACIANALIMR